MYIKIKINVQTFKHGHGKIHICLFIEQIYSLVKVAINSFDHFTQLNYVLKYRNSKNLLYTCTIHCKNNEVYEIKL